MTCTLLSLQPVNIASMHKLLTICAVLCFFGYHPSTAQEKGMHPVDSAILAKIRAKEEIFRNEKIGRPFPDISSEFTYLDGRKELFVGGKPKLVFFGYSGCAPCRFEVPVMAQLARKGRYKAYSFWYVTFDDSAEIANEFAKVAPGVMSNISIATIPHSVIDERHLTHGYPAKYFVGSDNIVRFQTLGGRTDDAPEVKAELKEFLDQID